MDIGHRMKELRIQYGLTQQELADRAELTKGFISQLERNQNSPSIGTLLDIIQCLGTTPAEFFTDEEPEQIVFKQEDYFEKTYLSFEMKMAKPEPEIFKAIIEDAGIEPKETLFIDDSEMNCKAAQNLGISTYTAKEGEDWSHLFNLK